MDDRSELLENLYFAEKFFGGTKYGSIVEKAKKQFDLNESANVKKTLSRLPSDTELLQLLIEKLKGKSVYTTLKRLGSNSSKIKEAKALSSLLTHAVISLEQGETEFTKLLPLLLSKVNDKVYQVIK